MSDLLRDQWGFEGPVVTDYTAIMEMTDHGLGDLQQVSALALQAGVDMDMVSEGFLNTLKQSLDEGKVTMAQVDQACRRILEAKYRLGLFEDPYRYCDEERSKTEIFTDANRQFAREIAAASFVLMKNEGGVLPLKKGGTLALVGPMADNTENMPGTWSVAADFSQSTSVRKGLEAVAGSEVKILYAKGSNVVQDTLLDSRISIFGKPTYFDKRDPAVMIRKPWPRL